MSRWSLRLTAAAFAIGAGLALPIALSTPAQALADSAPVTQQDVQAVNPGKQPQALLTLDQLDAKIAQLGDAKTVATKVAQDKLGEYGNLLLLQRSFIERAGFDELLSFATQSSEHERFLNWFLQDYEMLGMYVTGGAPGNMAVQTASKNDPKRRVEAHRYALQQLMDLCRAHGDDIKDLAKGDSRTNQDRLTYRKMMVSAALGMTKDTHFWEGNKQRPANPVKRYEIIKTFRANHEHYKFHRDVFDTLPVEQMRLIFENRISDEELPWLANYTLNYKKDGKPLEEGARIGAYTYTYTDSKEGVNWRWDNETFYTQKDLEQEAMTLTRPASPQYQSVKVEGGWRQMYQFSYEDKNFPNKEKTDPYHLSYDILTKEQIAEKKAKGELPIRMWMVMQRGGVCGAVAKTYENLNGMAGLPSTVHGQPGHATALRMTHQKNEATGKVEPFWEIQNNSAAPNYAGWLQLQTPEANHKMCGWEEVHEGPTTGGDTTHKYASADTENHMYMRWGGGPYVLLAQEALEDMNVYGRTFMLRALADAHDDAASKHAAIDAALGVQGFNQDVLLAKIDLLAAANAADAEWISFAKKACDDLKYQPLPMHSLMKLIIQKGGDELRGPIEAMRVTALERATKVTEAEYNQNDECVELAKCLLGRKDGKVATFSFTGEDAGKIKLGVQFKDVKVPWVYSIDGGAKWTTVASGTEAVLTQEEIASIKAESDIMVRMGGAPASGTAIIDITVGKAPQRGYANDNDNRFYTKEMAEKPETVANYEVQKDGAWVPLADVQPFEGNQTVTVRTAAAGTQMASDETVQVSFTDNRVEGMRHIPHEELYVNSYSSSNSGDWSARRVIDGWVAPNSASDQEFWHSSFSREDNPWITIDLGKERTIGAFDFWKRTSGGNGVPNGQVKVFAAHDDGKLAQGTPDSKAPAEFTEVETFQIGSENMKWQGDRVRFTFQKPVTARYIKIMRPVTKDFFSCAELDFFEMSENASGSAPSEVGGAQVEAAQVPGGLEATKAVATNEQA